MFHSISLGEIKKLNHKTNNETLNFGESLATSQSRAQKQIYLIIPKHSAM